jgi:hypothetical protein
MILMPKQKVNSFTIKRIQQGKATVKESAKVHLDLVKAEPENEERRKTLLDFSQALLDVMKEEDSKRSVSISWYRGYTNFSVRDDDKSFLVVCFAWLGMPEMCEMARKSMHDAMKVTVFAELREPIQRLGGIMRYQSFLTEALSSQDNITSLLEALDVLVDPSSETGRDPEVMTWSRQLIQKTVDSYDASRPMVERDATILMGLCARFGPRIFSERYVAPCGFY